MKHLKLYENVNEPEIGDYVICQDNEKLKSASALNNFLQKHMGQYFKVTEKTDPISAWQKYPYMIRYDYHTIPEELQEEYFMNCKDFDDAIAMSRDEIKHFSKNKKDLLPYITANKYNINR